MQMMLTLALLRAYNMFSYIGSAIWHHLTTLYSAVINAYSEKLYYFFDTSMHGFDAQKVFPWATGSAEPVWLYNSDTKEFMEWVGSVDKTEAANVYKAQIPFLSLEITDEAGKAHYDLTDFIETLKVHNVAEEKVLPSVYHVIGAWSLGSHIILDGSRFNIRYINTSAETVEMRFGEAVPEDEVASEASEAEEDGAAAAAAAAAASDSEKKTV
jgi:hypothetical protein